MHVIITGNACHDPSIRVIVNDLYMNHCRIVATENKRQLLTDTSIISFLHHDKNQFRCLLCMEIAQVHFDVNKVQDHSRKTAQRIYPTMMMTGFDSIPHLHKIEFTYVILVQ